MDELTATSWRDENVRFVTILIDIEFAHVYHLYEGLFIINIKVASLNLSSPQRPRS